MTCRSAYQAAFEAADETPVPDRTQWRTVVPVFVLGAAAASVIGKGAPALPALRADFGLDLSAAGWAVGAAGLTGAALAAGLALAPAAFGFHRTLLAGLLLLLTGAGLGSLSSGLEGLLVSRFLEGAGFAVVIVALPGLLSAVTASQDRCLVFTLWGVLVPLGTALTLGVAPVVMSAGWRSFWLALAVPVVVSAAWLLLRMRAGRKAFSGPFRPPPEAWSATLRQPALWGLGGAFAAYTFMWSGLIVWVPSFLTETRGMSLTVAAALTAGIALAGVPGYLLAAWFRRQGLSAGRVIGAATLCMGVCLPGAFSGGLPDAARYGLCLVFCLTGSMIPASAMFAVRQVVPPSLEGVASGFVLQGALLGVALGPPAAGGVIAAGGWEATAVLVLGALILAGVCSMMLGLSRRLQ